MWFRKKEPSAVENIVRFVMNDMIANEFNWYTHTEGENTIYNRKEFITSRSRHIVISNYYHHEFITITVSGVGQFQQEIPKKLRKQFTEACKAFKAYKALKQAAQDNPITAIKD